MPRRVADGTRRCELCRAPLSVVPCRRCVFHGMDGFRWDEVLTRPLPIVTTSAEPLLLEDKYQLVAELGRGGMGMVFHGVDRLLDRPVAVKFLLPELQEEPSLVKAFRTEALAMASIRHPNVAQIFSFGWYGQTPYFVMEYAAGDTVDVLLRGAAARRRSLPLGPILHIIDQAAAGLSAVHEAGVVHRDVKPSNLIYQPERERVMLMDFGVGRRLFGTPCESPLVTGGSPAYMAPELIGGEALPSEQEPLADIYALGITAFELVTGQLPVTNDRDWVGVLTWHLTESPPPPSSLRRDLPPGLDALVLRCLEKDRSRRFPSGEALREALRPIRDVVEAASERWCEPEERPPSHPLGRVCRPPR